MKNKKRLLLLLALPLVAAAAAVLILTLITRTTYKNPPVVNEPDWDSPQTRALVDRACYDCHSNETSWPFFTAVPGVSRRIAYDVYEGREHLNYSEWGTGRNTNRQAGEMIETIYEGEMPPAQYLSLHPEAKLSRAERDQLVAGIRATFGGSSSGDDDHAEAEDHEEFEDHDD